MPKLNRFAKLWPLGLSGLALALGGCQTLQQLPTPSWLQPTPRPLSQPAAKPAPQSTSLSRMEAEVYQGINQIRQKNRLSQFRQNDKLAAVARNYSRRMAEQRFFAHTSPQGDTMVERVRSAGIFYFMLGENLFTSTNIPQPAQAAITGWMNSPGHRDNILNPVYREMGIGVWKRGNTYYFTQLFMRAL